MDYKKNLVALGFSPKEKAIEVFSKKYPQVGNYSIDVDLKKQTINYGGKIKSENKTTQNLSQPENFVVLECVNRLLEKGYKPENIILEKTWQTGHGTSGRVDICVTRNDGTIYLMVECKTYGKEFDKELKNIQKNGGQLFTYFQQDKSAEVLMLYASELKGNKIDYKNEIIHIEEGCRQTNNVKDFYDSWNKLPVSNGIFEEWVAPYSFQSKALTPEELKYITQADSGFIFNRFLEILRHNAVSDKPNAFNKIFTLFLCKIYDEKATKPNEELAFQWFYTPYQYEGTFYPPDTNISFQKRLTDLYKKGMKDFLEKEVTDISDADFTCKYGSIDENIRKRILDDLTEIRLKKNNEFAIKEVFDDDSFNENAKVVKEVVELLQRYKIRYASKQQYLSDFFEMLLTTGLKQESGQFFTPVPIAQFIIKSLPTDKIVQEKLEKGIKDDFLPQVIDYASGSGHFITEGMHELQRLLDNYDRDSLFGDAKKFVEVAEILPYNWAFDYVYGIEKDYRLVKVGKVGCYLHGDGLARVIHSDGLGSFAKTKEYKGFLKKTDKDFPKENKQFDIVISNPPYSVSSFKNNASKYYGEEDFDLYESLTDSSSEIECLFIERTKQLLKDGGVAGIILPSSIFSNEGIYTKAREIILRNFQITAIAELGNNTFMATGTNTVVLFLRRVNNYDSINLQKSIDSFFINCQDVTLNKTEQPFSKYVQHVWEAITFDDYVSLVKKIPNTAVKNHEFYKNYEKTVEEKIKREISIKQKNRKTKLTTEDIEKIEERVEKECWTVFIETEKEKLLYFILAYPQQVVLVQTGEKDAEKKFLGYEFSNRRGNEGIHPIRRGINPNTGKEYKISDCTRLFDDNIFDNPQKASTYIYKAFSNDYEFPIDESLKNNISRVRLIDMLTFDRAGFAKSISTAVKKKVKVDSKWDLVKLGDVSQINYGTRIVKRTEEGTIYPVYGGGGETFRANSFNRKNTYIISRFGMSPECVRLVLGNFFLNDSGMTLDSSNVLLNQKYLDYYLYFNQELVYLCGRGIAQKNIDIEAFNSIPLPLPPQEIQQKIVKEIEVQERKEGTAKDKIEKCKEQIENICLQVHSSHNKERLSQLTKTNPSKKEIADLDINTLISFVDMPSVSNDGYIVNKVDKPYSEIKRGSYTYFREGDIIIAKITPCMENGKCALATNLTNGLALGSSEFHVLRADNDKINTRYLFTLLNRKSVRAEAEKNMTGTSGHRRVPINFYENLEIPLPPLSEQQKIVFKIEKIEAEIAKLEQQLAEIPKEKEAILKKYL
ncbi:MAG: N-6 DNA methylase [Bacteroidales bacterium]|nr:N-6 DNA methylase [Bacteroidales bacterium]